MVLAVLVVIGSGKLAGAAALRDMVPVVVVDDVKAGGTAVVVAPLPTRLLTDALTGTPCMPVAGVAGKPACGKRTPMFGAWRGWGACCCVGGGSWAWEIPEVGYETGGVVLLSMHLLLVDVDVGDAV